MRVSAHQAVSWSGVEQTFKAVHAEAEKQDNKTSVFGHKQTNKQTNKRTNKRANKQTNTQTNKHTNKHLSLNSVSPFCKRPSATRVRVRLTLDCSISCWVYTAIGSPLCLVEAAPRYDQRPTHSQPHPA